VKKGFGVGAEALFYEVATQKMSSPRRRGSMSLTSLKEWISAFAEMTCVVFAIIHIEFGNTFFTWFLPANQGL
jgi:hypothetical protein